MLHERLKILDQIILFVIFKTKLIFIFNECKTVRVGPTEITKKYYIIFYFYDFSFHASCDIKN